MIRKCQACESAPGGRLFCCTASFSVCSLRRANFTIIYPNLQLDCEVATLPAKRHEDWIAPPTAGVSYSAGSKPRAQPWTNETPSPLSTRTKTGGYREDNNV
jgi:hypothetical protein